MESKNYERMLRDEEPSRFVVPRFYRPPPELKVTINLSSSRYYAGSSIKGTFVHKTAPEPGDSLVIMNVGWTNANEAITHIEAPLENGPFEFDEHLTIYLRDHFYQVCYLQNNETVIGVSLLFSINHDLCPYLPILNEDTWEDDFDVDLTVEASTQTDPDNKPSTLATEEASTQADLDNKPAAIATAEAPTQADLDNKAAALTTEEASTQADLDRSSLHEKIIAMELTFSALKEMATKTNTLSQSIHVADVACQASATTADAVCETEEGYNSNPDREELNQLKAEVVALKKQIDECLVEYMKLRLNLQN